MSTSYNSSPASAAGGGNNAWFIVLIVLGVLFILALCVVGVLVGLLFPAVSQARMAAQRTMVQYQAREIGLALLYHQEAFGRLPAAHVGGSAGGDGLLSWRVAVLPFLEETHLHSELQLDRAWDDPVNLPLTDRSVAAFSSPLCPDSQGTNRTAFVAVVGPDTVLRADRTQSLQAIQDGASRTGMLLELRQSDIAWAQPRDVSVAQAVRLIQSCPQEFGLVVVMADGSVTTIPPTTTEEAIVKLFNSSDESNP
jgi:hypothetical protein